MKKFRPANGSYTQFYKEKLSIGQQQKSRSNLQAIPEISMNLNEILNKNAQKYNPDKSHVGSPDHHDASVMLTKKNSRLATNRLPTLQSYQT